MVNLIVAFSTHGFGIGKDGRLPWSIREDMKYFKNITLNSTVVMGYKTWLSIGSKPLKDRMNVVVSHTAIESPYDNVVFVQPEQVDDYIAKASNVFIIGGMKLFQDYLGRAEKIYATLIDKKFECDTFFPVDKFGLYEVSTCSELLWSDQENCNFRFVEYVKSEREHDEYCYLSLMKHIMLSLIHI